MTVPGGIIREIVERFRRSISLALRFPKYLGMRAYGAAQVAWRALEQTKIRYIIEMMIVASLGYANYHAQASISALETAQERANERNSLLDSNLKELKIQHESQASALRSTSQTLQSERKRFEESQQVSLQYRQELHDDLSRANNEIYALKSRVESANKRAEHLLTENRKLSDSLQTQAKISTDLSRKLVEGLKLIEDLEADRKYFLGNCSQDPYDLFYVDNLKAIANTELLKVQPGQVSKFYLIACFRKLRELDLSENIKLTDITWIHQLTELRSLDLSGTSLSDISPIQNISELRKLDLSNTKVRNLTPLRFLPELHYFLTPDGAIVGGQSDTIGNRTAVALFLSPSTADQSETPE